MVNNARMAVRGRWPGMAECYMRTDFQRNNAAKAAKIRRGKRNKTQAFYSFAIELKTGPYGPDNLSLIY
jgi:hypothetical protein